MARVSISPDRRCSRSRSIATSGLRRQRHRLCSFAAPAQRSAVSTTPSGVPEAWRALFALVRLPAYHAGAKAAAVVKAARGEDALLSREMMSADSLAESTPMWAPPFPRWICLAFAEIGLIKANVAGRIVAIKVKRAFIANT